MELDLLTLVTVSLMLVAFGMGLGLEVNDFKTVATRPKGLIAGSAGQILLLPAVAVALASFVDNPIVVVGLLLIAVWVRLRTTLPIWRVATSRSPSA